MLHLEECEVEDPEQIQPEQNDHHAADAPNKILMANQNLS